MVQYTKIHPNMLHTRIYSEYINMHPLKFALENYAPIGALSACSLRYAGEMFIVEDKKKPLPLYHRA